jgi:very-short-patch-repair endonuclease
VKLLLFFIALLLFAIIAQVLVRAFSRQRHGEGEWPFSAQKPLTRVEQVLYYRLVQTLPEMVVLAQVPLTRFLRVHKGKTWSEWHNRISQKSIDFLICERDFTIVAAIELDDGSHDGVARVKADTTKNRALTAAGVTLLRWRTHALPDIETIRTIINEIRDDGSGRDAVTAARVEPDLHISRIEASNDASIFHEETHP